MSDATIIPAASDSLTDFPDCALILADQAGLKCLRLVGRKDGFADLYLTPEGAGRLAAALTSGAAIAALPAPQAPVPRMEEACDLPALKSAAAQDAPEDVPPPAAKKPPAKKALPGRLNGRFAPYPEEHLKVIRDGVAAGKTAAEIAGQLGKTKYAVRQQILKMRNAGQLPAKVKPVTGFATGPYSEVEIALIVRRMAEGVTAQKIAEELNRPVPGLKAHLGKLRKEGAFEGGDVASAGYSEADETYLRAARGKGTSLEDMAEALGRTPKAVRLKLMRIGLPYLAPPDQVPPCAPSTPLAAEKPCPEKAGAAQEGAPPLQLDLDPLTARQRAVERRIRRLGYPEGVSPRTDMLLIAGLVAGKGAKAVAALLGWDLPRVVARWKSLHPSTAEIEDQKALVEVAKLRLSAAEPSAETPAEVAA